MLYRLHQSFIHDSKLWTICKCALPLFVILWSCWIEDQFIHFLPQKLILVVFMGAAFLLLFLLPLSYGFFLLLLWMLLSIVLFDYFLKMVSGHLIWCWHKILQLCLFQGEILVIVIFIIFYVLFISSNKTFLLFHVFEKLESHSASFVVLPVVLCWYGVALRFLDVDYSLLDDMGVSSLCDIRGLLNNLYFT